MRRRCSRTRMFLLLIATLAVCGSLSSLHPLLASCHRDNFSYDSSKDTSTAPFPAKFHQIWFNYTAQPASWTKAIKLSRAMNAKNFTYMLWSKRDVEALLEADYPWFLESYHAYPYDIQRVDAARYFILHKHGGFYQDMDIQSRVSFAFVVNKLNLSHFDAVLPATKPVGVSNDFMAAKEGSYFMGYLISSLTACHRGYGLPYVTVMASTGPLFLTKCLLNYDRKSAVYIMDQKLYGRTYFYHKTGSTWHQTDAKLLVSMWSIMTKVKRMIPGVN